MDNDSKPDVLFVSESRINQHHANFLRVALKFNSCFCVDSVGKKGGLELLWNDNINLSILSYSRGHIDCLISNTQVPFYFTGFYGNPKRSLRPLSWSLINSIASTHTNSSFF